MARPRFDIWTFILVTTVTVLIWYWAAQETRHSRRLNFQLELVAADPAAWIVQPETVSVAITLEGSRRAITNAERLNRQLTIEIPAQTGAQTINLAEQLRANGDVQATGVSIEQAEPAHLTLDVDAIHQRLVPIEVRLPDVATEGEVLTDPAEAQIIAPSRLFPRDAEQLSIEAVLTPQQLENLEPGRRVSLEARLRPTGLVASSDLARVEPATALVSFAVESRMRSVVLPTVRVHVQSPFEDFEEFTVAIHEDDRVLQNVTVLAEDEITRGLGSGDVKVMAVVYLSTSDKDQRIESKPVTYFLALLPDGRARMVAAQVGDLDDMPQIRLTIADLASGP